MYGMVYRRPLNFYVDVDVDVMSKLKANTPIK